MSKIGRNQLCPCGSGKKYKYCCLDKGIGFAPQKYMSKVEEYIANHEKKDILNLIVSLQLNPNNHGANVRLERLANLTTGHLNSVNELPVNLEELQQLLDVEFGYDHNEDPPINLLTEPFPYYGGNYQVFGGIGSHSVEILSNLTNVIGHYSDWPEGFKEQVEKGCLCLLNIVQLLADKAKLKGYVRGNNERQKFDYSNLQDYSLIPNDIAQILFRWNISGSVYRSFVWNDHQSVCDNDDPDSSALLRYPIVEYAGRTYVLMLSNEADCLNKYILETAKDFGCEAWLVERVHNSRMGEVLLACERMGWEEMTDVLVLENNSVYRRIYKMDTNWYADVYYVHDTAIDWRKPFLNIDITEILKTGKGYLKDVIGRENGYGVFTLLLYGIMGEGLFVIGQPMENDVVQMFPMQEFVLLSFFEKWDNLTLLHFAQAQQGGNFLMSDPVDLYAVYKAHSNSFYLSDEYRTPSVQAEVNGGYTKVIESKIERNKHASLMERGGRDGYIPVERVMDEGPIYGALPLPDLKAQCLECFDFPFWVICEQSDIPYSEFTKYANMFTFWMYCLCPGIKEAVDIKYRKPIILNLVFTDESLNIGSTFPVSNENYEITRDDNELEIDINIQLIRTLLSKTNSGERKVMAELVKALLTDWSENQVQRLIDRWIPEGMAKMMLVTDTSVNIMADPRWLPRKLWIPKYQKGKMLDMLLDIMKDRGYDGTERLETRLEKRDFLRVAVRGYLDRLREYCNHFDNKNLLIRLMNSYERLIYVREHNKLTQPAQLLCFGFKEEREKEINIEEERLTSSGLALRCLIEYVAAQPTNGTGDCGDYEVGIMMAYMHEIYVLGSISESIDLGMSNHTIKMLPSGRYGIYDDEFSENMQSFQSSYMEEMGQSLIQQFPSKLRLSEDMSEIEKDEDYQIKLDTAFQHDWGFSITSVIKFAHACSIICCTLNTSVVCISKSELVKKIQELVPEIGSAELDNLIEKFSLCERDTYLPDTDLQEYAPWGYNREYSYVRRFLVRVGDEILFGMRNATGCAYQLLHLLNEGRLNGCGECLKVLKEEICEQKGKEYTNSVRELLISKSNWEVWKYEMKIEPGSLMRAETNYGDIDVMAYDRENKVLYSLECKDTARARNIHEMKSEMDRFLGYARGGDQPTEREQQKSWIGKHLKRHRWLEEHKDNVRNVIKELGDFEVRSIMVTSSVLPISYLRGSELSLPIVAYIDISNRGVSALEEVWTRFVLENKIKDV